VKGCYKVITCDRHDEIVDVQASHMMGVAREICMQQVRKTHWTGNLGILDTN
jgi:hypothetical protein